MSSPLPNESLQRPKKRKDSPILVENPFVKRQNKNWEISPPPVSRRYGRSRDNRDFGSSRDSENFRDSMNFRKSGDLGETRISRLCRNSADKNSADFRNTELQGDIKEKIKGPKPSNAGTQTVQSWKDVTNSISMQEGQTEESQGREETQQNVENQQKREFKQDEPTKADATIDTAAVEAGQVQIRDHLKFFSEHLATACRPVMAPRISIEAFKELYVRNHHEHGCHFVIHQHDHPVAGVHYDLRLQFSKTSSLSFAIMYGLPGNPNSKRLNRNATETRVHNLWNHLIETASSQTGSLLIWDTGEYEVLPYRTESAVAETDHSSSETSLADLYEDGNFSNQKPENVKLAEAFKNRKIRLRLHGTKLPENYTLSIRLLSAFNSTIYGTPTKTTRTPRRRRMRGAGQAVTSAKVRGLPQETPSPPMSPVSPGPLDISTLSSPGPEKQQTIPREATAYIEGNISGNSRPGDLSTQRKTLSAENAEAAELAELEDEQVRQTNAYPGATNSIGSIHQRRWFLSLDRVSSGLVRHRRGDKIEWVPAFSPGPSPSPVSAPAPITAPESRPDNFIAETKTKNRANRLTYPFFVLGRDHETSVVTGRTADNLMADEGIVGYIGRKGWRAVLDQKMNINREPVRAESKHSMRRI